jgi:hypothetical protein
MGPFEEGLDGVPKMQGHLGRPLISFQECPTPQALPYT